MKESNIQTLVRMRLSTIGVMNFRNNVGQGWIGKIIRVAKAMTVRLEAGDIVIKNARPLNAGLHKGSGDVIGLTPVVITPEMVGKTVGIFTSAEIKTKTGRVKDEQKQWIEVIQSKGGIAGIVRSEDDANDLIDYYIHDLKAK